MNDNELESFISEQSSAEDEDPREAKALRHANAFFDFVEIATFTVLIILVLSCFLFRHTIVDGGSMMNTLQNGQHLIISDFLYTPKNGDIVVFDPIGDDSGSPLIKRVIATAGQTVEMRSGTVFVDGVALEESYVFLDGAIDSEHRDYPETLIPEGYVFVLGDHRNNSKDSRYDEIGLVDVRSILGRVVLRLSPFGGVS